MGGSVGAFLNFYVFPLAGLSLLALGGWTSWELWKPAAGTRFAIPSLAARVAGIILGLVWGWFLANLVYSRDALHVTVGFPMPVMTLGKLSGQTLEPGAAASVACVLLNLAIGVGLANAVLLLVWRLRDGRRPRRRVQLGSSRRAA